MLVKFWSKHHSISLGTPYLERVRCFYIGLIVVRDRLTVSWSTSLRLIKLCLLEYLHYLHVIYLHSCIYLLLVNRIPVLLLLSCLCLFLFNLSLGSWMLLQGSFQPHIILCKLLYLDMKAFQYCLQINCISSSSNPVVSTKALIVNSLIADLCFT